ncbi:glutamate:Na+ symporter, ESS family [Polaromonas sp. OV174]|uniref:sodium/glutamate symporter n=1 Tax=Polaromonas sp. OV174 TaxID=1855300 RepID=UPI0008F18C8E|nr:sodium/glutamate symporter [Polaromonas sp. OV174]SFB94437.1 glutamate:Na+ symporter, ESS family [Polaromonas sp. OV174]
MIVLELNSAWTLVAALATIMLGQGVNRVWPVLERASIPPAVSAGLLLSVLLALLRIAGVLDLRLDTAPRDVLLLVFFASLGFGAHLGRLATAGTGALVICLAVALVALGQNLAGMALAYLFGEPTVLGLFVGSAAYLGGHGTATAWAGAPQVEGLKGALEVGLGSATLGLVLGALIAGPVASWLMRREHSGAVVGQAQQEQAPPTRPRESPFSSDRWLFPLLCLVACMAVGPLLRDLVAAKAGLHVPLFLTVLLAAVLLTNAADALRKPFDTEATDLVGTLALRVFLAIAMLSLDWVALAAKLPLLLTGALVQVLVTVAVGLLVVYTLFGRGREGAAACGGFIGFSMGAMPVGLAVMRRLNTQFGDTPRALLAITLAASLFTDTANALILTALLRWSGGY